MPIFEYKGLNKSGNNVRGTVDAETAKSARAKLKKDGIFVTDIKDKKRKDKNHGKTKGGLSNRSVGVTDVSMMTRQLATLLKANIPLVDALTAVADQVENPTLKEAISDIKNTVNEGGQFHKSLAKYPRIFSNIYISMCEAGEMSGTLDLILLRLAEFTEAQSALNSKIRGAMVYPIIMAVVTVAMLILLFVFLIPKMVAVFEATPELILPWYTIVIIAVSEFIVNYWMIILFGSIGSWFMFKLWKKTPTGSAQWDAIKLKLPVAGDLTRLIAVSRFTRTLSTLLVGGVPMLTALDIVRNVVDNSVISKAIVHARDNISEGESIAAPLKKSGQFPPLVIHMITVGEKTGDLENMLSQVSDSYDFQVKVKIDSLTSIMEPVMIVAMGCVVAMIVFSILIPMFDMTNIAN